MSSNNMENHKEEGSDRKKQYCPEGDASKNEQRPQPQVNEAQLEAEDSDQDLRKTISDIKMSVVKPDSPEGQIDGINSDSIYELIFNTLRKNFGSKQQLNEQLVIPKFIDAEGDASKNKHRPQPQVNKAQLEAEDSDQGLRKTISDFKVKRVKPDSSRGQRPGPVYEHGGPEPDSSVYRKNPPVPNKEGHCSSGDVSMYEHGAQLKVNLARLETDSLKRYIRHFKIEGVNSDSAREQILNAVQLHFASQPPLNEQEVIPEFIHVARRLKNKDKKPED